MAEGSTSALKEGPEMCPCEMVLGYCVEGTPSYGVALARYLQSASSQVGGFNPSHHEVYGCLDCSHCGANVASTFAFKDCDENGGLRLPFLNWEWIPSSHTMTLNMNRLASTSKGSFTIVMVLMGAVLWQERGSKSAHAKDTCRTTCVL